MGEMCDFEAEYYPELWQPQKKRKKNGSKEIRITLNKKQFMKYKELGGAVFVKNLLRIACE